MSPPWRNISCQAQGNIFHGARVEQHLFAVTPGMKIARSYRRHFTVANFQPNSDKFKRVIEIFDIDLLTMLDPSKDPNFRLDWTLLLFLYTNVMLIPSCLPFPSQNTLPSRAIPARRRILESAPGQQPSKKLRPPAHEQGILMEIVLKRCLNEW